MTKRIILPAGQIRVGLWSRRQLNILIEWWPISVDTMAILTEVNNLQPGERGRTIVALRKQARVLGLRRDMSYRMEAIRLAREAAKREAFGLAPKIEPEPTPEPKVASTGWPAHIQFENETNLSEWDSRPNVYKTRPASHVPSASSAHTMARV